MITHSITIDFCWVCRIHTQEKEEHHVVPKAYGGLNGPTVTLCTGCHTLAHKAGNKLYAAKWPRPAFADPEKQNRLLYLGTVIANARLATEGLANKRVVYSGVFDGEAHQRVRQLCSYYGGASQAKIINLAIQRFYEQTFVNAIDTKGRENRDQKR